jgi:hypothetical protein
MSSCHISFVTATAKRDNWYGGQEAEGCVHGAVQEERWRWTQQLIWYRCREGRRVWDLLGDEQKSCVAQLHPCYVPQMLPGLVRVEFQLLPICFAWLHCVLFSQLLCTTVQLFLTYLLLYYSCWLTNFSWIIGWLTILFLQIYLLMRIMETSDLPNMSSW